MTGTMTLADKCRTIEIQRGLDYYGIEPNRNGFWSIRKEDANPSAKIHRSDPCRWVDFGGKGGSLIDLTMIAEDTDFTTAIHRIKERFLDGNATIKPISRPTFTSPSDKPKTPIYNIVKVEDIPTFYPLQHYIASRHIPFDVAADYLSEVHFQYARQLDTTRQPITMKALGWQSVDGSWHGRNGYITAKFPNGLKSLISGGQDITLWSYGSPFVVVFEGIFSALSAFCIPELHKYIVGDIIVLNSTQNGRKAVEHIAAKGYSKVGLMLDPDTSGKAATAEMITALANHGIAAVDLNQAYQPLKQSDGKDLNVILSSVKNPRYCSCRRCPWFGHCTDKGWTRKGQWTHNGMTCKSYSPTAYQA